MNKLENGQISKLQTRNAKRETNKRETNKRETIQTRNDSNEKRFKRETLIIHPHRFPHHPHRFIGTFVCFFCTFFQYVF
jgi:hypothetical protein